MSFGSYNPRSRYRDRAAKRFQTFLFALLFAGIAGGAGFWMGRQNAAMRLDTLGKELEEAHEQMALLRDDLTKVRADAQTAMSRFEQLQLQYQRDLPEEGPMRGLVDMLREQLSNGMSPDRLSFVIRSVRPPRNCADPATKRFMVRTPAYNGPDSAVVVGDGLVTLSGIGSSARNKEGQPEAWYDPTQPVSVSFKISGAPVPEKKTGVLPLQHSVIAGGREFRFTLAEGEKSFIKATYDSCEYP